MGGRPLPLLQKLVLRRMLKREREEGEKDESQRGWKKREEESGVDCNSLIIKKNPPFLIEFFT